MHVSSSENIQHLEKKIGYRFKKKALITEALTHKSFAKEKSGESELFNERLEFLGDATLELIISDYLFNTYHQYTEAELSKIKAYVVKESTLANAALKLDIGPHLHLGKGEEASGGREKPSLLANAFEAIIAAIYLDGGFQKARDFSLRNLEDKVKSLIKKDLLFDFKTRFQEIVQGKFGVLPQYRIIKEKGPEHMKIFETKVYVKNKYYGSGKGKSKKEAAQKAAETGLKKIAEKT